MTLYSKNGKYPEPIPNRIRLSDGSTRTDRTTYTPEEIADAGYVLAPAQPSVGADQKLTWTGSAWLVVDLTESEIDAREKPQVDTAKSLAADLLFKEQLVPKLDALTDSELDQVAFLYDRWTVGDSVLVDDLRRYEGFLYKVIQAHTTQANWTPDATPALWARVREPDTGTEWFAGEQVAVGDQRTYQGTTYEVIQAHTTQAGWEPPNVPALWSVVVDTSDGI